MTTELSLLRYLAATLKPRFDERDGRLEVWIDIHCRDNEAAKGLKRSLKLPGSVRGSIFRVRTPNIGRLLLRFGVDPGVVRQATLLDELMLRVNPTPADLKKKRKEQLKEFASCFRTWAYYIHPGRA